MKTLSEIRQQYPQYQDVPDVQLAKALHSKFYSDIPYAEFTKKLGFREVIDPGIKPKERMTPIEAVGEIAMGGLRGASRIGNTLLRPFQGDKTPQIEQFFGERADTESGLFKTGDIGVQIAGTAGVGGVLGKGAMALPKVIPQLGNIAPKVSTALQTGGFRLNPQGMVGPMAPVSAAGKVGNAALRIGAGGTTGGAMAGLIDPEQAGTGAVIGVAFPMLVKAAGAAGSAAGNLFRPAPLNSVAAKTLTEAQKAGYVVPPSMAGSGVGSRILEGVSGKYKTNQLAGIKNQNVTDSLARRALGLADDVPLTSDVTQQVRNNAYQAGYAPVSQVNTPMVTGKNYINALDDIANKFRGPARSFPAAEKEAVTSLVDSYKVPWFNADDAIKTIQNLRNDAAGSYQQGNKALGAAQRGIADALENQIERQLKAMGKNGSDLLKNFKAARTLMAKAHTVEDAIREGGGVVDAKILGRMVQRGKPLTGELAVIGKFANNFGDVAGIPKSGNSNPLTVLDMFTAGAGAGAGAPILAALPAARVASRYGILSQPYQQAFVGPGAARQSLPGLLPSIENPMARAGLLTAINQ